MNLQSDRRAGPPVALLHFIDGQEVPSISGRTFETVDPATAKPIGVVAFGTAEDVDAAVTAAWRAFDEGVWSQARPAARAAVLRKLAGLIRDRADELSRLESLDVGKPITTARNDVEAAAAIFDYAATIPENVRGHVFTREARHFSYSRREPYGVVGAISPWNFPLVLAAQKLGAALAVGNSVILKMAEQTPLSTGLLAQLASEAGIPAGVLNVVHGDGETTGAAVAAHPRVPMVTFTGSTDVGRKIVAAGAASMKSCHLELGGKTANIILADADIGQAIAGSVFTGFYNSGQICTAGSRLLVHRAVADEVEARIVEQVTQLPLGDPFADETRLGPLVSETQLNHVRHYVAAGLEAGATLLSGGGRPTLATPWDRGFFLEPAIFANVQPTARIAREEIFGPVLSVLRFSDDAEAIALANDVNYGLAATVWTNRLDTALGFAERLQAGIVWTNRPHSGGPHLPYEGHKHSGLGEDGGLEAIRTFTKLKVNHIDVTGEAVTW